MVSGEWYGIKLHYGRATGYNTYGRRSFLHGARIIQLQESSTEFTSWIRLEDGSVIMNQHGHRPNKKG